MIVGVAHNLKSLSFLPDIIEH